MKGRPPRRLVERRVFPGARPASPRDRDTGHLPRPAPRRAAVVTVPTDHAPATIGAGNPTKTGERRSSGAQDLFEIGEGAAATIGNAHRTASRTTRPGPDPVGRRSLGPGPLSTRRRLERRGGRGRGNRARVSKASWSRAGRRTGLRGRRRFFGRNRRTRPVVSAATARRGRGADPWDRGPSGGGRIVRITPPGPGGTPPARSRYGRTARGAGANEIQIGPVGVAELAARGRGADRWASGPGVRFGSCGPTSPGRGRTPRPPPRVRATPCAAPAFPEPTALAPETDRLGRVPEAVARPTGVHSRSRPPGATWPNHSGAGSRRGAERSRRRRDLEAQDAS